MQTIGIKVSERYVRPLHHCGVSSPGVTRRQCIQVLLQAGIYSRFNFSNLLQKSQQTDDFPYYVDVAQKAGLTAKTVIHGHANKSLLLSTTGGGVALFDYHNDGWLDIFLVNSWGLTDFPEGQKPTNHLYRNNHDGTFTDVTAATGLLHSGWGQGVCVGDYDNDGFLDLFVTYYGKNVLYHNNGDGTFTDVTQKSGVLQAEDHWNSGAA